MATYGPPPGIELRVENSGLNTVQNLMVYQGGAWTQVTEGHVFTGGAAPWKKVWGANTPSYHLSGKSNYVQQRLSANGTILTWAGFYPLLIPATHAGTEPSTPSETYLPTGITSAYVYAYIESDGSPDRRIDVILTGSNATHTGYSFLIELVDRGLNFTVTDSTPLTTSTDGKFTIPIKPYNLYSVGGGVSATNSFIDSMIAAGQAQETIRITILDNGVPII